jgi:GxxExxY protein
VDVWFLGISRIHRDAEIWFWDFSQRRRDARDLLDIILRFEKNNAMNENEIASKVIGICLDIHRTLGAGLFESVYEEILCIELRNNGLKYERQKGIPVFWKGERVDIGFRADLIIENKVILELKSVEHIIPTHKKQLLTYLKITRLKLGLLINFNDSLLKNGVTRIVNGL